jgi:hypothetical protein
VNRSFLKIDRLGMMGCALALLLVLCLLNRFAISLYFDGIPATGFAELTTARGLAVETVTPDYVQGEDGLMLDFRGLVELMDART